MGHDGVLVADIINHFWKTKEAKQCNVCQCRTDRLSLSSTENQLILQSENQLTFKLQNWITKQLQNS